MVTNTNSRKVVIDPVTRVEGHGKVTIHLDDHHRVQSARLHIVEFRGFERFIQGRPFWELPVLVQRLCGICPVSHHLAAAKATDRLVGGEDLTPTAEKVRRLMHYGQLFQSHSLHFFHLCSPDLLFGFDADPSTRNIFHLAAQQPNLAMQAVKMRKFGQRIIEKTAGKRIHGTGAIPGGVNRSLSAADRDELLAETDQMLDWARGAVRMAGEYTEANLERVRRFATFPSHFMALVRPDGAAEYYDGRLRAVDPEKNILFDQVENDRYLELIAEEVKPWTYMKFPFFRALGPERGWYRVGPLARLNVCDFLDTPEADEARRAFLGVTNGKPNPMTLAYHWARMIEVLHFVEKIRDILHEPDLLGDDLLRSGPRRNEAVGIIEAPRGTLFHHYRIDDRDQVTMANLIVSTTSNNEPMNRSIRRVAEDHLAGEKTITEGMLNQIEVAIRAYDPCLSCATHALGQMPLSVDLVDPDGNSVERRTKGTDA